MDIQLLLFILWLLLIIAGVCFSIAEDHSIALVFYSLSLACMVIRLVIQYKPEPSDAEVYEQKLQEIDKAEKELKKFLIDHPEFKETDKE